jgi:hypothetical protein
LAIHSPGPITSLLKQSLPSPTEAQPPESKKARLSSVSLDGNEDDTIEKRISSDFYTSLDQVRQDILRLRDAFGSESVTAPKTLQDAASNLADILSSDDGNPESYPAHKESVPQAGQVITLRTQTEKGAQQLYSGLQSQDKLTSQNLVLDGRRLPNGFDLTDPATINTNLLAPTKERRTFGDVFRPHRNLKALEMPRNPRTTFRSNTIGFSKNPNLDKATALNRLDYKFQQLPVSSWLNYSINNQQSSRRLRGKSFAQGDLRAALMANEVASQETDDASALFTKAFSSFALSMTIVVIGGPRTGPRDFTHYSGRLLLSSASLDLQGKL